MLDLSTLRDGEFSLGTGPPRLALVHHGFRTTQLGFKDDRRRRFAPRFASLGLLNIARSLQVDFENERLSHAPEFEYFDEDCYSSDEALATAILAWLRPATARFVLVGLYSLAFDRTASLLGAMDSSQVCVIVGGAHPTVAPEIDFAHIVVRGEGGAAMRHILTSLFTPEFGKGIEARGVCFTLDGTSRVDRPAFDRSLATIPSPAFPFELSQSVDTQEGRPYVRWWMAVGSSPQIYICTQSCRARCSFCSTYLVHGRAVSRPVARIEGDLNYISRFGHDSIEFHDDDLLQHEEFDDLMELLARSGLAWTCNARSEFVTPALAAQMAAAGCKKIFLGVESLSQESLDYYRKATTVQMNEDAVAMLDGAGIGVICGFIIGAPHDTLETSLLDIDKMLALPIYFLSASILTPDIGTLEYHRAKKAVKDLPLLGDGGSKNNLKPRPDIFGTGAPYGMPTVGKHLNKDQLNELYEYAVCAFFLRDEAIARIERYTAVGRAGDVQLWYEWIAGRAEKLAGEATQGAVRRRARKLVERGEGRVPLGATG